MKHLNTPQELFFSRQDPEDPRLGEFAGSDSNALATIWGYPDDEGVRLNGGRPGAALAPQAIRRALYRMTPARNWPRQSLVNDEGDYLPEGTDLAARAAFLKNKACQHYQQSGSFLVTLGGGHDYGFPDGAGFVEAFASDDVKPSLKPLVLNFDAHLDVRPLDRGLTSGTPFRRLLEDYKDKFDFFEIGILPHCNSPFHWEWAESQGAFVLSGENIKAKGLKTVLEQSLTSGAPADSLVKRPLWISLDIDCFSASEAPGCSAPNPFGLKVDEFMDLWPWLFSNFDVKGLGIYEVSPSLDVDNRTSRLAAFMIHASMNELIRNQQNP